MNISSIVIGDKVSYIGEWAFMGLNLTNVTISGTVTEIGRLAFGLCENLTSITLPESLKTIGIGAFDLTGLTSVTIPKSVTTIGTGAFAECEMLTSIQVANDNTAYSSDDGILYNKNKTLLHTYPAGKSGAFVIPASVTTLDDAFVGCKKLSSVTIPASVKTIGAYVFNECKNLKDVKVEWDTPPSVSEHLFNGSSISSATLYVPTGKKALYQAAAVWKTFGTISDDPVGNERAGLQMLKVNASNGVLFLSGLQPGKPLSVYNIAGQLIYKCIATGVSENIYINTSGVFIVVAGEQSVKVICN
jgi:hypothetical protein